MIIKIILAIVFIYWISGIAIDRAQGGLFWYSDDEIQNAALDIIWPYKNETPIQIKERFKRAYPPRMYRAVVDWSYYYEQKRKNAPKEEVEYQERMHKYSIEREQKEKRTAEIVKKTKW